jgi:hypothetical protein
LPYSTKDASLRRRIQAISVRNAIGALKIRGWESVLTFHVAELGSGDQISHLASFSTGTIEASIQPNVSF